MVVIGEKIQVSLVIKNRRGIRAADILKVQPGVGAGQQQRLPIAIHEIAGVGGIYVQRARGLRVSIGCQCKWTSIRIEMDLNFGFQIEAELSFGPVEYLRTFILYLLEN